MTTPFEHARGRWPEIVTTVLGEDAANTRKHQPCPGGKGGTDCYRFSDKTGAGNFFCQCSDGRKDGFELIRCTQNTDFKGALQIVEGVIGPVPRDQEEANKARDEKKHRHHLLSKLNSGATSIPRSNYLASRGIPRAPSMLRWHPEVPYWKDGRIVGKFPAMLAPITKNGRFLTFHATYLDGQGNKAALEPNRKVLPGDPISGGAIELCSIQQNTALMGVAEGIETALAAAIMFRVPVWSVLSTSGMKSWRPPEHVRSIFIFADNDTNFAGQAAAYQLAHTISGKHRVHVMAPAEPGLDWNDKLLMEQEKIA